MSCFLWMYVCVCVVYYVDAKVSELSLSLSTYVLMLRALWKTGRAGCMNVSRCSVL